VDHGELPPGEPPPGGFGDQIYEAADAGEITEAQAGMLVRSFLSAGLDTTVSSLGNAVHLFATNPEQWDLLRADPSLARPAFEETIRLETPVQVFSRTATPRSGAPRSRRTIG
jgi:cytochrome P450